MSYGYGAPMNSYGADRTSPSTQPYCEPNYGAGLSPQYSGPTMGRDEFSGQNVEMASLAQNGSQFGQQQTPNPILNACSEVNQKISKVNEVISLLQAQQKLCLDALSDMQRRKAKKQIDDLSSEIMSLFRELTGQVKSIKQKPEASSPKNAPQVERLNREVLKLKQSYEVSDANYRKQLEAQIARQVRIVRPDASEEEIRAAVENPESQIFSQALMQSDRQRQAQSTQNNVRQRHEEIQKIESQMIELAALFEDMNNLVIQQEEAVINVEAKGEAIVEDMDKGVVELGVAVESARNARKWKWWCLGIAILILIIIGIVVVVYKFFIQTPVSSGTSTSEQKTTKRFYIYPNLDENNPVLVPRAYPLRKFGPRITALRN